MALTEERTHVWRAHKVEQVMSKLVRSQKPVFIFERMPAGRQRRVLSKLGREFFSVLGDSAVLRSLKLEFPQHTFHPLIELFWKHVSPMPPLHLSFSDHAELLVNCVKGIRQEASSVEFRKRRYKHRKYVLRNTESLLNYIDELFERWGRLLVIRVDIGYRVSCFGLEEDPFTPTYAQVRQDREQLFKYLNSKGGPGVMRGFAWSLEMGRTSSYHHHLLLFFDGHQSRQDVSLARRLGEHWKNAITEGRGRYYNCNADEFDRRGVGMIDYWETEKLSALKEVVAPYLTKADYLIRTMVETGKTFSHGRVPPVATRTGRPRKPTLGRSPSIES